MIKDMNRWEKAAVFGATGLLIGTLVVGCATRGGGEQTNSGNSVSGGDRASSAPAVQFPALKKHEGLAQSQAPELRKLAQYEKQYGPVANKMMLFTDTPPDAASAQEYAARMATKLKEFEKAGVEPLVIMEPANDQGPINFNEYKAGAYDDALNAFFGGLKSQGISDKAMGTWVSFPEANSPEWGTEGEPSTYITDPAVVAACITRTVQIQKNETHFPHSGASIMLNSLSYPDGDAAGEHGAYKPLDVYTSRIPKGLIDSVGLQGFPWSAPANEAHDTTYDPKQFLNAGMLMKAAEPLGVRNIWFNTGTFGEMYANDNSQAVRMGAQQRGNMLNGVLGEAAYAASHGYGVTVNLFAENKSGTEEGTDWSYGDSDSQAVFKRFVSQAAERHITLSLFDTTEK